MFGPWLAERRMGGTPWHAHHIAERYGCWPSSRWARASSERSPRCRRSSSAQGWTVAAVLVAVAGTGLTFGMWWVYFVVPQSQLLHAYRRERPSGSGICHFSSSAPSWPPARACTPRRITSSITRSSTPWAPCCPWPSPSAVYILGLYLLYMLLVRTFDAFHLLLVVLTAAVLVAAVLFADAGMSMANCPAHRHAGTGGDCRRLRTAAVTGMPRKPSAGRWWITRGCLAAEPG